MMKVIVPATTANVGPGFDCLGIALNLYNTFYIEEIEEGLIIEGCEETYANENNLIYRSMKKCFEKVGYDHKGIKIKIENDIPISRGLGSSASCIVGGIVAANEIAGGILSKKELLDLATEIEGHPDNVAPCIFGGMTVAISQDQEIYYSQIKVSEGLKFCAMIPNFRLSTERARGVLPKKIDYKDGIFNVGRVSLLLSALANGEWDLVKHGCKDRLHQPYRGGLIENFDHIIEKCEQLNSIGVFLSGAGPTIMAMVNDDQFADDISEYVSGLKNRWMVKKLNIDYDGVRVQKG
ncbi:homoserine kinase [Lutibacter sp. B2]|nr:homoserine kinase [Lutibacter sp. B2]